MAGRNADRDAAIVRGTKNVFADLGYPDAAERQAKLRLAYALNSCSMSARCLRPRLPRCSE